jgi:hypothetical protein
MLKFNSCLLLLSFLAACEALSCYYGSFTLISQFNHPLGLNFPTTKRKVECEPSVKFCTTLKMESGLVMG